LEHNKNLLCEPSDPNSIKQAISYLIGLSIKELDQIGRINEKIAREEFDKEKNLQGYLQLYN
jgi:glycosyltransferase involved in cell wall biosynthesis